jgi:predicted dehydrogenase
MARADAADDLARVASAKMAAAERKVRWGILSTARVAAKVVRAIRGSGNADVIAVASRDEAKARAFAEANGPIAKVYGSYEALLDDAEVEAVYIPLPTAMRAQWVIAAAKKKKHVLCEKPAAVDARQLDAMVAACKSNKVLFMDGVVFAHNPRLAALRKALDDEKSLGRLKRVTSDMSFFADSKFRSGNIRLNKDAEPQGCVGDLGWYNVRFALWVFGFELPASVSAEFHHTESGVPTDMSGFLNFGDHRVAAFHCSFDMHKRQWAEIVGEKGVVLLPQFQNPAEGQNVFTVESKDVAPEQVATPLPPGGQDALMIKNFCDAVLGRVGAEEGAQWIKTAYITQCVVDALMDSGRHEGQLTKVKYGVNALL